MNTVLNPVLDMGPDGLTMSMVEVDAAAARAALADHLHLAGVDLEHPVVVAVLAAVVSAGWRPPTPSGGSGIFTCAGPVSPSARRSIGGITEPSSPGDAGLAG
jgi:hypothetical protein